MMQLHQLRELGDPTSSSDCGVDSGFRGGRIEHAHKGGEIPPTRQQLMWGEPAHLPRGRPTIAPMQNENIVRTLRRRRGLKQAELAAELGISRSHLSKVENGSDAAGRQLLEAMAVFFRVPIDTFFPATMAGIVAPLPTEAEEESEMLGLWRGMDEEQRKAFLTLLRLRSEEK